MGQPAEISLLYYGDCTLAAFLMGALLFVGNVVAFTSVEGAAVSRSGKRFLLGLVPKVYKVLDIPNKNSLTSKSVIKIDLGIEGSRSYKINI